MPPAVKLVAAIIDIDGIPDHETTGDLLVCLVIGPLKRGQCAIRKDDAPPIGDIRRIALNDGDIVRRTGFLDEQAAIESGRASAEDGNLHYTLPSKKVNSA